MCPVPALPPERLHSPCDPAGLGFATTAELADADTELLHPRAVEAIRLALDIPHEGYNLFVLGDTGSGRHAIVSHLLEAERGQGGGAADWCYVWNFGHPSQPRILRLPCGRGPGLRDDMNRFVEELIPAIGAVFESDDYRARLEALQDEAKQREEQALRELGDEARARGVALLRTPHGFAFVPMKGEDDTLTKEEFDQLPEARQKELGEHIRLLHDRMQHLMAEFPRWRRELQNRIREAGQDALGATVAHMIDELKARHADLPAVLDHLDAVHRDILASGESLRAARYARLFATLARREGLRPLSAGAVARLIEHAARLAGDAERLSTQTQPLDDRMHEAEHFAAAAGSALIEREHVEAALAAHRRRHERLRLAHQDAILRGQWLVDSSGSHVGQVNGLAVVPLGDGSFAHPVRITATVRVGEGEIIDIEREVKLAGPIHSKGVLILSAFLAARFGWLMPLSLKASLVFEQSYGGVEGDSASLAELCALLSALARVPLSQARAVTGSVNQFGVVQPVGGINEKIEGFFELCEARGLDGEQGVLIPQANVCNLMLRQEVADAVRAGRFTIWAVADVDEALELLTGLPAGTPAADGTMAEDSVNGRAIAGLKRLAQLRRAFGSDHKDRNECAGSATSSSGDE